MTLRKKNLDKSVIYVNKDGHSHSVQAPHNVKDKDSKPTTGKKNFSNHKLSPKNKNFNKNTTAEGFRKLK